MRGLPQFYAKEPAQWLGEANSEKLQRISIPMGNNCWKLLHLGRFDVNPMTSPCLRLFSDRHPQSIPGIF